MEEHEWSIQCRCWGIKAKYFRNIKPFRVIQFFNPRDKQSISNCCEISNGYKLCKLELLIWDIFCTLFWFLGINKFLLIEDKFPGSLYYSRYHVKVRRQEPEIEPQQFQQKLWIIYCSLRHVKLLPTHYDTFLSL